MKGTWRTRAGLAAGAAGVAAALALWVVPAISQTGGGEWVWLSGPIAQDNGGGTGAVAVYNGSASPQQVTVRGLQEDGGEIAGGSTITIGPGQADQVNFSCDGVGGCFVSYEIRTTSELVVPSIAYMQFDLGVDDPVYSGAVAPGGFVVVGPDGRTTATTVAGIDAKTAALQRDAAQARQEAQLLGKQLNKKLKKVLKAVRKRR